MYHNIHPKLGSASSACVCACLRPLPYLASPTIRGSSNYWAQMTRPDFAQTAPHHHPRGGIPRPIGYFPESLSQAILVGIMLVGRLGVVGVSEPVVTGAPQTQHPLRPQVFRGLIGTGLMGTYLLIITSDLETDKIEPRS